jgi:hypothetical protein
MTIHVTIPEVEPKGYENKKHWEKCTYKKPSVCSSCFLLYYYGLIDWYGKRTEKPWEPGAE